MSFDSCMTPACTTFHFINLWRHMLPPKNKHKLWPFWCTGNLKYYFHIVEITSQNGCGGKNFTSKALLPGSNYWFVCAFVSLKSKRGQTFCSGCNVSNNNRYKPDRCSSCNYLLGGTYQVKPKKVKLDTPQSVKLFTQEGYTYYSAKTHSKDSRCIVIVDGEKKLETVPIY